MVNWTNEEGCRFAPAMIASGVFAQGFDLDYGLARADHSGRTIGAELARIGYAGELPVGGRPAAACSSCTSSRGRSSRAKAGGSVSSPAVKAPRWYDAETSGAEAHAGPTPMERRRDPLRAAAALLEQIYQIAHAHAPDGRATVGEFQAYPGSRNTVPGRVRFTIDLRHPDGAVMDAMDRDRGRRRERRGAPRRPDRLPGRADLVRAAGRVRSDLHRRGAPGGGHARPIGARDREPRRPRRRYMARVVPTAMIFVPCKDGISHNEAEYASPVACADGANVLLHAVLARAA